MNVVQNDAAEYYQIGKLVFTYLPLQPVLLFGEVHQLCWGYPHCLPVVKYESIQLFVLVRK